MLCKCSDRADILVTDDNIFNLITLETILQSTFKLKCDKALNGQEAINRVVERMKQTTCLCERQRNNYKVIFMDCNMPVMDGFKATREIR